jgi:hypothetical protein
LVLAVGAWQWATIRGVRRLPEATRVVGTTEALAEGTT